MTNRLRLILDGTKLDPKKINREVIRIKQIEKINPSAPIFSVVIDAMEGKSKIFKFETKKEIKQEMPALKFLAK